MDHKKKKGTDVEPIESSKNMPKVYVFADLLHTFNKMTLMPDGSDSDSDVSSAYVSCTKEFPKRNNQVYRLLNQAQKSAYREIHESLSSSFHFKSNINSEALPIKKNVTVMIDTESGTGKTYLLSALAITYRQSVKFIVFRKDAASEISLLQNVTAYTYISFNMRHFGLSYYNAIRMFKESRASPVQMIYFLLVYAKNYRGAPGETIILDTFTIASPVLLLLLYIVAFKNRINMIFAGNKIQQGAICSSNLHAKNNYYIVQMISDVRINNLSTNMRTSDPILIEKLLHFRKLIQEYKPEGNVPFRFNFRYLLYTLFRQKYFTETKFDNLYMSEFHKSSKQRMVEFVRYLEDNKKAYSIEPFQYRKNLTVPFKNVSMQREGRFYPALVLVVGCKYIYVTEQGLHQLVQLEEIVFKDVHVDYLIVHLKSENRRLKLDRCLLNYYQILPAYREWLLDNKSGKSVGELRQFPLRMYTLTYHAALERTIENVDVEFDADCNTANSIYVGLCCLRHDSAVYKIHADRDLLSLVVTDYMENVRNDVKYYYKCPPNDKNRDNILKYISQGGANEFIDSISWITIDNTERFDKKLFLNAYVRIERSMFVQSEKAKENIEESVTQLMQATKFLQNNMNAINETIKAMNCQDGKVFKEIEKDVRANKWKDAYESTPSYKHLQTLYKDWYIKSKSK